MAGVTAQTMAAAKPIVSSWRAKFTADWVLVTTARILARWMLENGTRCTDPKAGAVILLPIEVGAALGTYINNTDVLFIGPGHHVIQAPLGGIGQIFWMNR